MTQWITALDFSNPVACVFRLCCPLDSSLSLQESPPSLLPKRTVFIAVYVIRADMYELLTAEKVYINTDISALPLESLLPTVT